MDTNALIKKFIMDSADEVFGSAGVSCDEIILEAPKLKEHGDVSTNTAMRLAGRLKAPSMDIAQKLVDRMRKDIIKTALSGKIAKIEVKQPGFINFFLTNFALVGVLERIQKNPSQYGRRGIGKGRKLQVEFVSANPTGPLSVAHGRQAAVGDSIANILEFAGWRITREYFINDEGRQMDILGESIRLRYLELLGEKVEFPEDGYKGAYIRDIAQTALIKYGKKYAKPANAARVFFRKYGCKFIMDIIKDELKDFGVRFDVWASQAKIVKAGKIQKALAILRKKGFLYDNEGAVWFKSTAFGDDKDRVVVKSDGSFTYLAPDIAYHKDKFSRGFDKIINIWGPDHHGYIPRLAAACQALGYPKDAVTVLIVQLATLYRGQEQIPMSTRSGEFITLRQVMSDVGRDAARFFFVSRKIASHLDFDLELAKQQSKENPVYYVQYAHARICSILETAKEKYKPPFFPKADLNLLKEYGEIELIKSLGEFPNIVVSSAESFDPYGLAPYLINLANNFHSFYDRHRVLSDDVELTKARLVLVDSARVVIAAALGLLAVSAPKKM